MYVLASLSAIFFPLLAPIYICFALRGRQSPFLTAVAIGMLFGILASCIDTVVQSDLDRYASLIDSFRGLTLLEAANMGGSYSGQIVYTLIFWLLANLRLGFLLNFIVGFVAYSVPTYILFDYCLREKTDRWHALIILCSYIVLVPFFNMISYVRSTLAFSIVLLAAYLDLYRGKKSPIIYILYISAPLLHYSTLPIVALSFVAKAHIRSSILYLFGALIITIVPIVVAIQPVISLVFGGIPGLSIIASAANRLALYVRSTGDVWAIASQNSSLISGYRFLYMGMSLLGLFMYGRLDGKEKIAPFYRLIFLWCLLTVSVGLFITFDVFFRYAMPLAVLVLLIKGEQLKGYFGLIVNSAFAIMIIASGFVQIAYLAGMVDVTYFAYHFLLGVSGFIR